MSLQLYVLFSWQSTNIPGSNWLFQTESLSYTLLFTLHVHPVLSSMPTSGSSDLIALQVPDGELQLVNVLKQGTLLGTIIRICRPTSQRPQLYTVIILLYLAMHKVKPMFTSSTIIRPVHFFLMVLMAMCYVGRDISSLRPVWL